MRLFIRTILALTRINSRGRRTREYGVRKYRAPKRREQYETTTVRKTRQLEKLTVVSCALLCIVVVALSTIRVLGERNWRNEAEQRQRESGTKTYPYHDQRGVSYQYVTAVHSEDLEWIHVTQPSSYAKTGETRHHYHIIRVREQFEKASANFDENRRPIPDEYTFPLWIDDKRAQTFITSFDEVKTRPIPYKGNFNDQMTRALNTILHWFK